MCRCSCVAAKQPGETIRPDHLDEQVVGSLLEFDDRSARPDSCGYHTSPNQPASRSRNCWRASASSTSRRPEATGPPRTATIGRTLRRWSLRRFHRRWRRWQRRRSGASCCGHVWVRVRTRPPPTVPARSAPVGVATLPEATPEVSHGPAQHRVGPTTQQHPSPRHIGVIDPGRGRPRAVSSPPSVPTLPGRSATRVSPNTTCVTITSA